MRRVVLLVVPLVAALAGCTTGIADALRTQSPACSYSAELFNQEGTPDRSERLTALADLVPEELRSTVERLAGEAPLSVSDAKVQEVREWAISACGAAVAVPAVSESGTPHVVVTSDGASTLVSVTGATTLDEALQFCINAVALHGASGVRVVVYDDFGVLLADTVAGDCAIAPSLR